MPKLKVKQLEWYMKDPESLFEDDYCQLPEDFKLIGRDGYYCFGNDVWFEVDGCGFRAYPRAPKNKARDYFCYDLKVNDEAILPSKEAKAMLDVLKTTRDSGVRKALNSRLRLHEQAISIRDTSRRARISRTRFFKRSTIN